MMSVDSRMIVDQASVQPIKRKMATTSIVSATATNAIPAKILDDVSTLKLSNKRQCTFDKKPVVATVVESNPLNGIRVVPKKVSDKTLQKLSKVIVKEDGSIKPLSEIKVSTRTAIVFTNCPIDLHALFQYLPITDYTPPVKKRGRKPKNNYDKPSPIIPFGAVVSAKMDDKIRGVKDMKPKSKNPKKDDNEDNQSSTEPREEPEEDMLSPTGSDAHKNAFFRHCVSLVISIDDSEDIEHKFKNVKVNANGNLQITGCKNDDQYVKTVEAVYKLLFHTIESQTGIKVVKSTEPYFRAVFNTVMHNIDFNLGFHIFRNKLDQFINNETHFKCIFEGSQATCVLIKIPIPDSNNKLLCVDFNHADGSMAKSWVDYNDYKHLISKRSKKEAEHTFLVFATGHVIFTSNCGPDMETVFYKVVNILLKNRKLFEVVDNHST